MAYKESVRNEELWAWSGLSYFWNVSSNVGYTCQNKEDDVLLIQFFLNRVFDAIEKDIYMTGTPPKRLVPDGDFGGKTWGAIKWYQKAVGCVADGMISSADGTRDRTPKHGKLYTIHELNIWYQYYYPAFFQDLRADPGLPTVLCSHLSAPPPEL